MPTKKSPSATSKKTGALRTKSVEERGQSDPPKPAKGNSQLDDTIREWLLLMEKEIESGTDSLHILTLPKGQTLRFCIVGVTKAGKTSLMNAIFDSEIGYEAASAGTTDKVMRALLPSGIEIFDTPGANDPPHRIGEQVVDYENITRQFLGLEPVDDEFPALDKAYVCKRDHQEDKCPHVKKTKTEFQGSEVYKVDYPQIPKCQELGCKSFFEFDPPDAVDSFRPDVVLEVLTSSINRGVADFHKAIEKLQTTGIPLVIAQRVDSYMSPQQRKEIEDGAAVHGIHPIQVDCKTDPSSVSQVVEALLEKSPNWARDAFNQSVAKAHRMSRVRMFMDRVSYITVGMAEQVKDLDVLFDQMPAIIRKLMLVWVRTQCADDGRGADLNTMRKLPDFNRFASQVVKKKVEINRESLRSRALRNVLRRHGGIRKFLDTVLEVTGLEEWWYSNEVEAEIDRLAEKSTVSEKVKPASVEEQAAGLALCYRSMINALVDIEELPAVIHRQVDTILKGGEGYSPLPTVLREILELQRLKAAEAARGELRLMSREVARVIQSGVDVK